MIEFREHFLDSASGAAVAPSRATPWRIDSVESRLKRVIDCHFDPAGGSAFWLDRARQLRIDPRRDVHGLEDLALLGELSPADLRERPLLDYIPRALHSRMAELTVAQTGGTTGGGTWTAYEPFEFRQAFVDPFTCAASAMGFPRQQQWLFVGPSGPHIIGKVVRHLSAEFGSAEPFMVDFDPRWAKKLPSGSFARRRYLSHVIEQAMLVINSQEIGVLFTTPPVLAALGATMTAVQRRRICAVHYGGMTVTPQAMRNFQTEVFPEALHLAGYGNTLFGCCLELSTEVGRTLDYFPYGNRLILEVVDETGSRVAPHNSGRVRFTRLDETILIVRLLERDVATAIPCPPAAPRGFSLPGVRDPHTPDNIVPRATAGLY